MAIHFNLSIYWLLLPLAVGLCFWVFIPREDERSNGYLPDPGEFFRLIGAAFIILLVLCVLLVINLWLK